MFVRWQSRGNSNSKHYGDSWSAILVRSKRVDGKPRQEHVAYLGSITDKRLKIDLQRCWFWNHVTAPLEPVWEVRRQSRAAEASSPAVQKERPQPTAKDHAIRLFDHIAIWLSGNSVEPAPVLRVLIELLTEELEDSTALSSPPRGRS
jgi:hypothetical protein